MTLLTINTIYTTIFKEVKSHTGNSEYFGKKTDDNSQFPGVEQMQVNGTLSNKSLLKWQLGRGRMKRLLCTCRYTIKQKRNSKDYFNLNLVVLRALVPVYYVSHSSIGENLTD